MAFQFFLNYTRANNDPYLQQFVKDLSDEVRGKLGLREEDAVAFFDQQDIELGATWDATIGDALADVKTMVSVASPAFFKSIYCGRERALFRRRFQGAALPLIKPIIWIPFSAAEAPAAFAREQFTFGDPKALHNAKGVKYIMRQMQRYHVEYNDLITDLADQLLASAIRHPLLPLDLVPSLGEVASEFETQPAAAAWARPTGPTHVRFMYLALHPQSIGRARSLEPYLDAGGTDWKPFYPDMTPIHLFAQKVVASDELGFTSDSVPFGPNLLNDIKSAWRERQIVVLVVDPWSLHWDVRTLHNGFQDLLRQLDEQNGYHWCVLLPWNERDAELAGANRPAIELAIANTFPFHGRLTKNPMFYREGIKSLGELKVALAEVLARLKDEIRRQATVEMPIPQGPDKVVMASPSTGR